VRLLTADQTFMIEKEFQCVIGDDHPVSKERDTGALTRFCVAPGTRNEVVTKDREVFSITALLFKEVYRWCAERDIRFIYGVTDRPIHKYLTMRGYPYERIGNPRRMPDGVVAIAVRLDWRTFESLNSIKRPRLLTWYTQKSMSLLPRATAMA
jgi:N-acyl-L-homoserine lactone synthetase